MENRFTNLLLTFASLPKAKSTTTVFEIAGYPHYENVASNLLAFFLNAEAEHELGDLVMSALLSAVEVKDAETKPTKISREYDTGSGRIDLLIKTGSHVVGIENKIFHHVANDLADYARTVKSLCSANQPPLNIILSLNPVGAHVLKEGFINLTYRQLWEQVRCELGHRLNQANPKWVTLLNEFIQTTENLSGMNMDLQENDQFFIDNNDIIETLVQERDAFWRRLGARMDRLREFLQVDQSVTDALRKGPWIYQGTCLVFEFGTNSQDHIKLDLNINPEGWRLTLFGQTNAAHAALIRQVEATSFFSDRKARDSNDRFIVDEWDLLTEQDLIIETTSKWIQRTKNLVDSIAETR